MKNQPNEIPLSPVTGWSFGTIPIYDAIFLELSYLSYALQKPEEAQISQKFVFQAQQLRGLQHAIGRILDRLETDGFQPPPPDLLQ